MKKLLLISIFSFSFLICLPVGKVVNCFAQPYNKGPYEAGWTSATLNREGRTLNSIIYYPSFVEGSEAVAQVEPGPVEVPVEMQVLESDPVNDQCCISRCFRAKMFF